MAEQTVQNTTEAADENTQNISAETAGQNTQNISAKVTEQNTQSDPAEAAAELPEAHKKNRAVIDVMPEMPYAIEEALNRLRINVSFLGEDVRKIMVVSSEPNEGKSFIAMQLWRQLAASGEKSILVDADLRHSVMVDTYEISREDDRPLFGLSDYLSGAKTLEECILSTDVPTGDILPNVNNIVNPSMLLESRRFSEMLERLSETYRYIIFDVPPLEGVSDGERIGNLCDGALFVVRSGVTPRTVIRGSRAQLERAGCPILGVVLSRAPVSKGGYYSKYYGKYYGNYYYGKE